MRITKDNIEMYIERARDDDGINHVLLDISVVEKGKGVTHIDYLPDDLTVLHLGSYHDIETLPKLPDSVVVFTNGSSTLIAIPNIPKSLVFLDLRTSIGLDDGLRVRFDCEPSRTNKGIEQQKEIREEFINTFCLKNLLTKI